MAPGRHETAGLAPYASPPPTGSRLAAERCAGHGGRVLHLVEEAPLPRYMGVDDPHAGLPTEPGSALMGGTRLQTLCH